MGLDWVLDRNQTDRIRFSVFYLRTINVYHLCFVSCPVLNVTQYLSDTNLLSKFWFEYNEVTVFLEVKLEFSFFLLIVI